MRGGGGGAGGPALGEAQARGAGVGGAQARARRGPRVLHGGVVTERQVRQATETQESTGEVRCLPPWRGKL